MLLKRQESILVFRLLFFCIFLLGGYFFGDDIFGSERRDSVKTNEPSRYRVETLKHISSEEGKKYLEELKIGTVSSLPSPNTLLITAKRGDLIKASAIIKLVDSEQKYVIKSIFPVSKYEELPSVDKLSTVIGDISIGTFLEPPIDTAKVKAIIDIHGDSVIAIAPVDVMERIISAMEQLEKGEIAVEKIIEPNEIKALEEKRVTDSEVEKIKTLLKELDDVNEAEDQESETAELFEDLLNSLAESEKPEAEPEETKTIVGEVEESKTDKRESVEQVIEKEAIEDLARAEELTVEAEEEITEQKELVFAKRQSYDPEQTPLGEEELELNLPETLNLIDLLDLVGKYLQLDYMYEVAELRNQQVALKVQGPIKVKELYPLVESVMKFKGFVMSRKGNLVTIVPVARVLDIDPQLLYEKKGKITYGDVIVSRVFQLRYVDTASAENLLKGMKLGMNVKGIPESGTLIVTGYTYRMKRIEELLEMIDKPGVQKKFEFRQLKYTMAQTLVPQIQKLSEQLGTVSVTVAAPTAAAAEPKGRKRRATPTKAPSPSKPQVGKSRVYLEADERTNRILMIGLEEQLAVVNRLIDTLDVEQQDLRTLRLYDIQHVGAEEVREKLEELGVISGVSRTTTKRAASTRKSTGKATTRPVTPPTSGKSPEPLVEEPQVVIVEATNSLLVNATSAQHEQIAIIISYVDSEQLQTAINYIIYPLENQDPMELSEVLMKLVQETITEKAGKDAKIQKTTTVKKIEDDVIIVPDEKTYSLIVYANKKNQQWISSLISELDEYRPQVLLDVTLVEITKNDAFKFDLDIISKYPTIPGVGGAGSIANIVSPTERLWELGSTAGAGGSAFYGDDHIQALLTAMDTKGYGRVLARPKILVNDNEEGVIKSEEKVHVVREKTIRVPGQEAGSTDTETDVTFEPFIAGIELSILPHISKGNELRLQISLMRTDFRERDDTVVKDPEGDRSIPTPPDLLTSDVTTVVTVPDRSTIILGGLETMRQSKSGTKIPILGDIPLIGGLFKNTVNKDDQSRLYVFVKAHILRPGDKFEGDSDIMKVSRKNRRAFEEYEKKFQELEDWPGIEPEPMDPVRILEEDE